MYSILIYIIIAFLFYIFTKDIRKELIEGQTLESYDYQEFQPIINDDIINEQLKKHLNKYSKDIDRILKNTIKDKNVDSRLIKEDEDDENILYDIYLRDVIGQLNNKDYDEQTYQNYLDNYIKFNKNNEILSKIPYSDNQLDLFENKYKKDIFYSNEYNYMDINDVNERIKKVKEEIKDGQYVEDGVNFPGFISKIDGKVINNMVNNNASGIFIKNLDFCCDYSMLNLENVSILSNDEKFESRLRHDQYGDDGEEVERHFQYNYPYYTYMKEGDRKYDSLYLNYNKTRNIGDLNL